MRAILGQQILTDYKGKQHDNNNYMFFCTGQYNECQNL